MTAFMDARKDALPFRSALDAREQQGPFVRRSPMQALAMPARLFRWGRLPWWLCQPARAGRAVPIGGYSGLGTDA